MTSPTDQALVDRDALQRAFAEAQKDSKMRAWIERRQAKGQDWLSIARSCACYCQGNNLHLAPWQMPPASPTIRNHLEDILLEPHGPSGRREAAELLKKLYALGLSHFEPDPEAAVAQAALGQQVGRNGLPGGGERAS